MGRLEGKTALITGAARGIGAAAARRFVSEGANVVVSDIRDDLGQTVADELGSAAAYVSLDVAEEAQWDAAVALAQERFGKLDVLVNNAGIVTIGTIEAGALEDYHRAVAVNQTGVWLGIRAVAPAMRAAGGGSIINIGTVAAMQGNPGRAAYGAAKWATRGMSKSAAVELAPDKIRVNCVQPGSIRTEMLLEAGWSQEQIDTIMGPLVPAGRVGEIEDMMGILVFLASDESLYMTGDDFIVDGGATAGPLLRGAAKPAGLE